MDGRLYLHAPNCSFTCVDMTLLVRLVLFCNKKRGEYREKKNLVKNTAYFVEDIKSKLSDQTVDLI